MSSNVDPKPLPVADAAPALGVSERTLRRLLSVAPFAGRTTAEERQTPKGCRRTTLLPPDLLADLKEHVQAQETSARSGGDTPAQAPETLADTAARSPAGSQANAGVPPNAPPNERAEGELPAVAYQAIIGRQEREIEYLKQLLGEASERQRLTLEALTREQSLRALEAPTIAQETRPAPDDTGSGPEGAQAGAGDAPGATAAPAGSWLGRLLGFGRGT